MYPAGISNMTDTRNDILVCIIEASFKEALTCWMTVQSIEIDVSRMILSLVKWIVHYFVTVNIWYLFERANMVIEPCDLCGGMTIRVLYIIMYERFDILLILPGPFYIDSDELACINSVRDRYAVLRGIAILSRIEIRDSLGNHWRKIEPLIIWYERGILCVSVSMLIPLNTRFRKHQVLKK